MPLLEERAGGWDADGPAVFVFFLLFSAVQQLTPVGITQNTEEPQFYLQLSLDAHK